MNEHKYKSVLKQCETLIRIGKTSEALKTLQELYKVKPIRLYWYIVYAEYLWKINQAPDFDCLSGKSWMLYLYPEIRKLTTLYINMVESYQDIPDIQRHKLLLMNICDYKTKEEEIWLNDIKNCFRKAKINFLEHPESEKKAEGLFNLYFSFHNSVQLFLLDAYMRLKKLSVPEGREWFLDFPNCGYLAESLMENSETPFILIEDETSDGLDEKIVIYILQQFHKKIYYLKPPISFEVEQVIDIEETAAVSMDSMEVIGGLHIIYPASIIYEGEYLGDNREYVLNYIIQNEIKHQSAVVFTSGILMDNLCCQPVLKKNMERLYGLVSPPLENQMVFGWAGNYLAYISQVHDTDAEKLMSQSAEYPYSIIVPARNSARTLRYTLMTCLMQRYDGNYEIVLSDNSTPGNTEVYQLYKELDDPRIKYYRTPREYNLSRSFEFAFLHAKGEFLLSIGSDDALLPWALDTLDDLRKKYPNEDIIQWERGFYAWPGFNGGQQHQLTIPRKYQKGNYAPEYHSRQFYFGSIFNNSSQMYLLPNLYLNSGCHRNYLKTILAKTGRLFDGICQDIYMGIVNASINDKILNIRYPLTIAGMSGGSMGAKANMVYELKEDEAGFLNDLKKTANIGGYCASSYERLMPEVTTDKSSLYNCILRMIARGIIAESDLEYFDFRKWFMDVFGQMDIRDPLFDKKVHYFRYTASLHGEDFLKWFDDNIYHKALRPCLIDEEKLAKLREKKCYTEGVDQFGGQTVDASKYGVQNVYDAVMLFEKLSNL